MQLSKYKYIYKLNSSFKATMYNFLRGVLRNTHGFVINLDHILNQTDDHNFEKYKHISISTYQKTSHFKIFVF